MKGFAIRHQLLQFLAIVGALLLAFVVFVWTLIPPSQKSFRNARAFQALPRNSNIRYTSRVLLDGAKLPPSARQIVWAMPPSGFSPDPLYYLIFQCDQRDLQQFCHEYSGKDISHWAPPAKDLRWSPGLDEAPTKMASFDRQWGAWKSWEHPLHWGKRTGYHAIVNPDTGDVRLFIGSSGNSNRQLPRRGIQK